MLQLTEPEMVEFTIGTDPTVMHVPMLDGIPCELTDKLDKDAPAAEQGKVLTAWWRMVIDTYNGEGTSARMTPKMLGEVFAAAKGATDLGK